MYMRALSAVILSPLWGVSHVALWGRWACRGRVISSGVSNVAHVRCRTLTSGSSLLDALLSSRSRA
jgi:hypothetical protein